MTEKTMGKETNTNKQAAPGGFRCQRFYEFLDELGAGLGVRSVSGCSRERHSANISELETSAESGDCPFCFRCKSAEYSCKSAVLRNFPLEGYRNFFRKESIVTGKYSSAIDSRSPLGLGHRPE